MKVFNWVHRRFLNAHSCTSFVQENDTEKDTSSKVENEKHGLLEHDAHMVVEMLDNWKDGILSIGTLAISPLDEANNYQLVHDEAAADGHHHEITNVMDDDDHHVINDYDIELTENDGEVAPLMNVEFFSHELEKVIGANHEITEEDAAENYNCCDLVNHNNEGDMKRRVTLAELFMEEDSDLHTVKVLKEFKGDNDVIKDDYDNEKQGIEMIMKRNSGAKSGFSNAKNLLKKDLHPLKKFNQLMKRMMKKKIHPDLEAKMQKDMQMFPSYGLSSPTNDHDGSNNEFASLLLIQDAMV